MESISEVLRRRREAAGLSLRALAQAAHIDPGHLSRIENGTRPLTPQIAVALDQALGEDGVLAAMAGNRVEPWRLSTGRWRPADAERLAHELVVVTPSADNAIALAHDWLASEPPQIYETRTGRRIGDRLVKEIERRVHQLRLLDDHAGGANTHAMVTGELAATADLLRSASFTEDLGRRILVAVGELCQLAGWTLSDAGRHERAEQVYLLGVRAGHAAGDVAGAANNLSSLSYQVANTGDPLEAERLARSAYAGAKNTAAPLTRALLGERVAWASARAGLTSEAEQALGGVDEAFTEEYDGEPGPLWTYWLDQDEIKVMQGRVWTELERPLRAVPILEEATERYGDDTVRETALYASWLAESLLQAKEIERAAAAATKSLRLSRQAGSARADDRVAEMRRQMARHRGNAAADAFLEEAGA